MANLETIRIGLGALSANQCIPWLCREAGLFREEGLDAVITFEPPAVRTLAVVVDGEVDVGLFGGYPVVRAAVEGKGGDFASPKAEKETLAGTRGGVQGGVNVHSARMPGRMAHHELVFGTLGQTLTIRHDSINRESFMPGVLIAVRQAVKSKGLTVGLDRILGL